MIHHNFGVHDTGVALRRGHRLRKGRVHHEKARDHE